MKYLHRFGCVRSITKNFMLNINNKSKIINILYNFACVMNVNVFSVSRKQNLLLWKNLLNTFLMKNIFCSYTDNLVSFQLLGFLKIFTFMSTSMLFNLGWTQKLNEYTNLLNLGWISILFKKVSKSKNYF